jgi:hypothetical protein
MKDLYSENFKTIRKEIEEYGKIAHTHGLTELILLKRLS